MSGEPNWPEHVLPGSRRFAAVLLALACLFPALPTPGQMAASATQVTSQSWDVLSPDADHHGSVNVPMDSWIYPALERLAAMGYIPSQNVSIRPWTRQECLRQLRQAQDIFFSNETSTSMDGEAEPLIDDLKHELDNDRDGFTLESTYARVGTIAGPALNDSFHFGQTWWNDYGRHFATGISALAGYSLRATSDRFFFHVRQEAQRVPGAPGITPEHSVLFNQLDGEPTFNSPISSPAFPPTAPGAAYFTQTPLDLYAGVAFAGNALSFGKQEIFWGPTAMGPWSFSMNAEPTYNLRLNSTRPHPFPFFSQLGTYKFDIVIGKLSGHKYPARPYFNGQKADFTFGNNLEISFTRWSVLWGVGHPMTLGSLRRNLFSGDSTGTYLYGDRTDPGDRKSDFDFHLHVPGLRKYATIYADSYSDDDVNPIDAPRRAAWSTGLYLPRVPALPHADFRFEMSSSEELSRDEGLNHPLFINNQYRDANTNKGFLLGNAVGRDGRSFEGRVGYWKSARSRVEVGYRQTKISSLLLPQGGTISDGFGKASLLFHREWTADVFLQQERFLIPADIAGSHSNTSARVAIIWTPQIHFSCSVRRLKCGD